jgi:hypothetical protein
MAGNSDAGGAWGLVLLGAVLERALVGLHPHSGQGKPPGYGDYEAQRHWMVRPEGSARSCPGRRERAEPSERARPRRR